MLSWGVWLGGGREQHGALKKALDGSRHGPDNPKLAPMGRAIIQRGPKSPRAHLQEAPRKPRGGTRRLHSLASMPAENLESPTRLEKQQHLVEIVGCSLPKSPWGLQAAPKWPMRSPVYALGVPQTAPKLSKGLNARAEKRRKNDSPSPTKPNSFGDCSRVAHGGPYGLKRALGALDRAPRRPQDSPNYGAPCPGEPERYPEIFQRTPVEAPRWFWLGAPRLGPNFGFAGLRASSFPCMRLYTLCLVNSPGHWFWAGWRKRAKRLEILHDGWEATR